MLQLIKSGLLRNRQRSLYTVLAVAIAFATFIMLSALRVPFSSTGLKVENVATLGVGSAVSERLPIRYVQKIAALPSVRSVSYGGYVTAYYQEYRQLINLNVRSGSGVEAWLKNIFDVSEPVMKQWRSDPNGILVGRKLARKYHWAVGDTIPIKTAARKSPDGSDTWYFKIDGIFHSDAHPMADYMSAGHWTYINRSASPGMKDTVSGITVTVNDPVDAEKVADRIDRLFMHSFPPTQTTADIEAQAALAKFGNVSSIITFVLVAVFFVMFLVVWNVIVQSVAERRAEFGLLKAIGFGRSRLLILIGGEALLLNIIGAAVGTAVGSLAAVLLQPTMTHFLSSFSTPVSAYWVAALVTLGSTFISASLSAMGIMRLRPTEAL